jgi:uncharacterized protein YjaG (DUF416 family)
MAVKQLADLEKMDFTKQLIFAYLSCERLYPNYIYFSTNYNYGSPQNLRKALNYIRQNIFVQNFSIQILTSLLAEIEKSIPEPANFDTVLASSALDACTVSIETLNFVCDKTFSHLESISTMSIDTAHMYIQEKESLDFNTDLNFQKKIDGHPLMINEIETQIGIIKYLTKVNNLTEDDLVTLLELQSNKGSLQLV